MEADKYLKLIQEELQNLPDYVNEYYLVNGVVTHDLLGNLSCLIIKEHYMVAGTATMYLQGT